MNINKHNYEAYFLDYHEGNLAPQQVADLLLFVEQHPELKEEFESFENITLNEISDVVFENKNNLKKVSVNAGNKDEYFIGSVEGILTPSEKAALTSFTEQHPEYSADFDAYKKTKLTADQTIVFEGKNALKLISVPQNNLLIAAVEGLLSPTETAKLAVEIKNNKQTASELQQYKNTVVAVDPLIVFDDKESLKRKERKAIPFYYYVASAAAILFLFGLYFMFNTGTSDQKFAETKDHKKENVTNSYVAPSIANNTSTNASNTVIQKDRTPVKNGTVKKGSNTTPLIIEKINVQPETNVAENVPSNEMKAPEKDLRPSSTIQSSNTNVPAVAQVEKKKSDDEFLSIAQVAATKIKEQALDPESLAAEKKSGRFKKFSGWDVLQVMAKGVSKITGRDVEVKPTYNDEGEVTAYAFNAGKLGFSKER